MFPSTKAQPLRAAVYARYSSDNQSPASIDDQVRICRAAIERHGWHLVQVYSDHAISGASTLRSGRQRLLADAAAGAFDVVVAEAVDRLSRNLSDTAYLHGRLTFLGIRLHAVNTGEIIAVHAPQVERNHSSINRQIIRAVRDDRSPGRVHIYRPGQEPGMKFVQMLRDRPQLGRDGNLEKLAVPLWPDAGKALGLSRNHTYDAARAGEIPTVKFGRTIRVPLAALRKMLEEAGQKPGRTRSDRVRHEGAQMYGKRRDGMKVGGPTSMPAARGRNR